MSSPYSQAEEFISTAPGRRKLPRSGREELSPSLWLKKKEPKIKQYDCIATREQ